MMKIMNTAGCRNEWRLVDSCYCVAEWGWSGSNQARISVRLRTDSRVLDSGIE